MDATPIGGSLNIAVDRLDRALEALEARVRALQSGEPLPDFNPDTSASAQAMESEYQRVLEELQAARLSNAELAEAANTAYDALGAAATHIRQLLSADAA